MKSRRPPLNLSETKTRSRSRAAADTSKTESGQTESGQTEPAVELTPEEIAANQAIDALGGEDVSSDDLTIPGFAGSDLTADDLLEAPLTTSLTPERLPPELLANELFAPEAVVSESIPPEPTPERRPVQASAVKAAEDDLAIPVPKASATKTAADEPDFGIASPPPEAAPPVRFGAYNTRMREEAKATEAAVREESRKRDIAASMVEPQGVLKTTGASPLLFWGVTGFISLLWACGLGAFVLGAQNDLAAFAVVPFRLAVLAFLALFPIGLIFASAFALRNAAALARQSARAAALADSMLAPATSAAMQTTELVDTLRAQVDHAVRAVRLAHADITELSAKLKSETDRLHDAAQIARAATQSVTRSLEHEREAVTVMSDSLGKQASGIIEAVDRQARMVADASDLAQTQLREAEATLAVRATDMMTAANDVSTNARLISEDLDRQTQRLETAGSGVASQIRSVEEGLSQQRAGLVSAALSLRADQEDFAVHIENQRAQLTEALAITRVATVDLGETSARGVDVLRDIVLTAQENFRSVMGAAENERTAFETRIHATLSNISVMAADARDDLIAETRRSLEQLTAAAADAKRAADSAAQTAQSRVDRLNETIFEASKKADEVFDSRFNAARRLIEDSADLINQAGDQTAEKLDSSFAHTRATIAEVNEALNELTSSADQLPLMARDRLHEIRSSVEEGLAAMTAAARKAALETEAVDQAFQDRVKRNYDMLTEAVRLMGVISGDQPLSAANLSAAHLQAPVAPQAPEFRDRDYGRTLTPPRQTQTPQPAPQPVPRPAPQPVPQPAPAPAARLRLTPLGAETRPSAGPAPQRQPQPGSRAGESNGWSWRDLLNGMDGAGGDGRPPAREQAREQARDPLEIPFDAPRQNLGQGQVPQPPRDADFDNLDDVMVAEVSAMGVDAAALLSRARIDEMIGSIIAENNEGARNLVRRVAPAAIRRLSRRLAADPVLRQQANEFATAYDQQINIALMSKDATRGLQEVLSNDHGRAYLLVDAAISDLI